MEKLCDQMARIGQYAVNPRLKIDWADAHSDAFQPDLYSPMRRQGERTPWDRGAEPIRMDGMEAFDDDNREIREWGALLPREPIR
jgi:hypothetical protein